MDILHWLGGATQAAGQWPIDVTELGCDALFGASRKWLRGPRGLGFLYIREPLIETIRPPVLGRPGSHWIAPDAYALTSGIERLSPSDFPYVLLVGLAVAVRYAMARNMEAIAARNRMLGLQCREALRSIKGVSLYDAEVGYTGTIPFNIDGLDADRVVERLEHESVRISALRREFALYAFERLGLQKLGRISLHYFNTVDEIDRIVRAIEVLRLAEA